MSLLKDGRFPFFVLGVGIALVVLQGMSVLHAGSGCNDVTFKDEFNVEMSDLANVNTEITEKSPPSIPAADDDIRTPVFQRESTRRERLGSWLGNTWIPPDGSRQFSAQAMRNLYKDKTILWMGDSTARRAGLTMFEMFESSTSTLHVEYAKLEDSKMLSSSTQQCSLYYAKITGNGQPRVCRRIPGEDSSGMLLIRDSVLCTKDVWYFFKKELQIVKDYYSFPSSESRVVPQTKNVKVIVISIGPWEIRKPGTCVGGNKTLDEWIDVTVDVIEAFQQETNITIVWKTSGFIQGSQNSAMSNLTRVMNSRVMDRIDALRANDDTAGLRADSFRGGVFTYVNWGAAVEPRSFGKERNVGDHVAHYGLESRLVLFQMMTNHLRDSGFFAQPTNNITARLPL
jgi:hypothetical protein